MGPAAILQHVSRCWASLFTERAVTYRLRNGFDHRKIQMAVVVQQMVFPDAAGILFTADPITGHRKVAVIEASFGLGEALVSGLVNADTYRVRNGEIVAKTVAAKRLAIHARPDGGTEEQAIDPAQQEQPALTDAQVVDWRSSGGGSKRTSAVPRTSNGAWPTTVSRSSRAGRSPRCSPSPRPGDDENHVYLSVGHQQMMTDPMKPLGLSMWQLTALVPMHAAAGGCSSTSPGPWHRRRAAPVSSTMMGQSDPLTRDAVETVLDRGDFIPSLPDPVPAGPPAGGPPAPIETDPTIVAGLIERSQASIEALKRDIATLTGPALFDFLLEAFEEQKRVLRDPLTMRAIMAGMDATWWLNEQLQEWLGEKNAADTLTLSAPDNVTSEMGLALLDVADVIRPHPEVVTFLTARRGRRLPGRAAQARRWPGSTRRHPGLPRPLRHALRRRDRHHQAALERTPQHARALDPRQHQELRAGRPPAALRARPPGGRDEGTRRARALAGPAGRGAESRGNQADDRPGPDLHRVSGVSEVRHRQSLLHLQAGPAGRGRASRAGARAGEKEDVFYLTFSEFHDVARTNKGWMTSSSGERKEAFRSYQTLTPPRVLTSEGEVIAGSYRRDDVPAGALVGLAVSAGTVEGRARVILDMADADLEADDILVTAFTDPSWSPAFVTIKGLVTQVGGLMTHGAVIAREYGLPAVVGVEHATRLIRDGQRIRVNGTDGYVEILT